MSMIRYIRSFKEFVPTWIICVFMFFWIFVWPLIIAIALCIIQFIQRRHIKNRIKDLENQKMELREQEIPSEESLQNDQRIFELNKSLEKEKERNYLLEEEINEKDILLQNFRTESQQEIDRMQEHIQAKESEFGKTQHEKEQEIDRLNELIREKEKELDEVKNRLQTMNSDTEKPLGKKFVLCAGKYKGGIDIPIGIYNLKVISGRGDFRTNVPEDIYENISSNPNIGFGFLNEYRNLEITEKTILKISESAKIEFSIVRKYDYSKEVEELKAEYTKQEEILKRDSYAEKSRLETEIRSIEDELKILNNTLIEKYYIFSDYDGISSEECKDKLLILKQNEKELRQLEKDVLVVKKEGGRWKISERTIRQILRNFNSECDNIMMRSGLKNIDSSRNKIVKSYETLNKLFSVDGVSITKKLLELKLEEITLLYTYELKYQQEKEIQKAIKEQMVEEAKAQREIEEQKKKIEKDLQQHVGEVNRLMKYLQKANMDAEKQMYMDKIQELEEKIKSLETDKQTVLEREANATAGFVYIISNIGSFGENIYKIGMTRRLEPMDRIHELSSASVPFEFDVHAMIFSSNAPELENALHKHFLDRQVNKVNPRKEFFNVDIDEIERVVKKNYNDTVQFTKIPIATEYRQSLYLSGATS